MLLRSNSVDHVLSHEHACISLLFSWDRFDIAHEAGVLHTDLETDNDMLVMDGNGSRVVITDLGPGSARATEDQLARPCGTAGALGAVMRVAPPGGAGAKGDSAVFVQRTPVASIPDPERLREGELTRWLECLHCNQKVTRTSDRIEVNGKHQHSFINPAGVIYRIGCFASAAGVLEIGEASDHFTWFAGHVWRIALCARCERHLGWGFRGDDAVFYGLVLTELKEAT